MGLNGSKSARDAAACFSPWTTEVRIRNQLNTPVLVWLCRDAEAPSAKDAIRHEVAAYTESSISSGWLREPRATLLIRTGINGAMVLRMPHASRLLVKHALHGLTVESTDEDAKFEDFADPGAVPGHDTVPMRMRRQSFSDGVPALPVSQDVPAGQELDAPIHGEAAASLSPQAIHNQSRTPAVVWLCRDADAPSDVDAVQHAVPAEGAHGIITGGPDDATAAHLIRTSMDEAKVARMPHATCLGVKPTSRMLLTASIDADVTGEDFADPGAEPGYDAVPMQKQQSFADHALDQALAMGGA